jgi:hypothetical protein
MRWARLGSDRRLFFKGFTRLACRLLTVNASPVQALMSSLIYDEMRTEDGDVRPHYRPFADWLERTPPDRIA